MKTVLKNQPTKIQNDILKFIADRTNGVNNTDRVTNIEIFKFLKEKPEYKSIQIGMVNSKLTKFEIKKIILKVNTINVSNDLSKYKNIPGTIPQYSYILTSEAYETIS